MKFICPETENIVVDPYVVCASVDQITYIHPPGSWEDFDTEENDIKFAWLCPWCHKSHSEHFVSGGLQITTYVVEERDNR